MKLDSVACIDVICALAKDKGIKIGKLETDVGLSVGYLARLKRDGGSFPTVEKLYAIAEILKVPVGILLDPQVPELSDNQRLIYLFVNKISDGTFNHSIVWERKIIKSNEKINESKLTDLEKDLVWKSRHLFISDTDIQMIGASENIYTSILPGTTKQLVFIDVIILRDEGFGDVSHHNYVLYLSGKEVLNSSNKVRELRSSLYTLSAALNVEVFFDDDDEIETSMKEFLDFDYADTKEENV